MEREERLDEVTEGRHDRGTYVRTLIHLRRTQQTGVLSVKSEHGCRRLYLLEGQPLDYRSNVPADAVDEDLVDAGLIPRARIGWFRERLTEGQHLEDALLDAEVVRPEEMDKVRCARLQQGVGAPLEWADGTWEFQAASGLDVGAVELGLRPEVPFIQCLWSAVCAQVEMDEVLPMVTDRDSGGFLPTRELKAAVGLLGLEPPLSALPSLLGAGAQVDHLSRQLPECSGDLVRLLWFLEAGGLVERSHDIPEAPSTRLADASAPAEPPPPVKTSQPASRPGDELVAKAYSIRMDQDYYTFLQVPRGAEPAAIKVACRQSAQEWHALAANPRLGAEDKARVQELLRGVQQVWSTFTDTKRKAAYDEQLEAGTAPQVESNEGGSAQATQTRGFQMGPDGESK